MKKVVLLAIAILMSLTLFAGKTICEVETSRSRAYGVGDVVDTDFSWTDNNGETHSIHELTANGKAVVIFWGEDW